jgi:hypothetical protein
MLELEGDAFAAWSRENTLHLFDLKALHRLSAPDLS